MSLVRLRTLTPGRQGTLPRVVVIGGQRCGTTSLFRYLAAHPQVAAAHSKELNYFSLHHDRGLRWYRGCFPTVSDSMVTMEASPLYLFDPRVPERAAAALPQTHFIALVRNPTERAYSHYLHNLEHGVEPLSFADALAAEPKRLDQARTLGLSTTKGVRAMRNASYVHRGLYAERLTPWMEHVGPDRLHVVQFEQLFESPERTYGGLLESLALDAQPDVIFQRANHWDDERQTQLTPSLRAQLDERFAQPNEQLRRLLGWQTSWTSRVS